MPINSFIVEKRFTLPQIISGLGALIGVTILSLHFFGVIKIPYLPQKNQSEQKEAVNPFTLDTCDIKKEGNPLVKEVSDQAGGRMGTITGMVENLKYDEGRGSYIVTLTSSDGAQSYDFNLLEDPTLSVITSQNKVASLSDLKKGDQIDLFFTCDTQTNLFRFIKTIIK